MSLCKIELLLLFICLYNISWQYELNAYFVHFFVKAAQFLVIGSVICHP